MGKEILGHFCYLNTVLVFLRHGYALWSFFICFSHGHRMPGLIFNIQPGWWCHNTFWGVSFFSNNKFIFIGVQFASIQNNTQCSSCQVPTSVSATQSPPLPRPPPFPPLLVCFPELAVFHVLSPFLIFPTYFFSFPLYSLSLFFIFPKWMRPYNVCPSPIDSFHSA